jgi:hypothetical protein
MMLISMLTRRSMGSAANEIYSKVFLGALVTAVNKTQLRRFYSRLG